MAKKEKQNTCPSRLGTVGGSAVLEGVMMKGKEHYAVAVRCEDGSIRCAKGKFQSMRARHKWLNIPILRGCVSFVESMVLSMRTLNLSASIYACDDSTQPQEGEKSEAVSAKTMAILSVVATVFALFLSVGLFIFLPALAGKGISKLFLHFDIEIPRILLNVIEGCVKVIIFLLYLWLVSFMPDIKRTFQYHGAEHQSIFCYESGEELTAQNAGNFKRFHPRCGTSFLFVMIILGIAIASLPFVPWDNIFLRTLCKLALLPLVMGIGFEFLMLAGKHPNLITRILSAPGLWIQRLTTRAPSEEQLQVAIVSLKCALPEVFGNEMPDGAILIDAKTLQPIASQEETQDE